MVKEVNASKYRKRIKIYGNFILREYIIVELRETEKGNSYILKAPDGNCMEISEFQLNHFFESSNWRTY